MRGEMVITEADMQSRFSGERDLITYEPYHVGDRIVECDHCKSIIKTEFITSDVCPVCEYPSFRESLRPQTTMSAAVRENVPVGVGRSLKVYFWLLLCAAAVALLPYCFESTRNLIASATFGIEMRTAALLTLALSVIAFLVLYLNHSLRASWQFSDGGFLLLLVPTFVPYAILAAIWLVIAAIAVLITILVIAFVIGIISAIVSGS